MVSLCRISESFLIEGFFCKNSANLGSVFAGAVKRPQMVEIVLVQRRGFNGVAFRIIAVFPAIPPFAVVLVALTPVPQSNSPWNLKFHANAPFVQLDCIYEKTVNIRSSKYHEPCQEHADVFWLWAGRPF